MTISRYPFPIDPHRDLVLDRVIDVPRALVWRAWTEPEHLKPWFCPKPWQTTHAEIDVRPGGIFRTVMEGPDGEKQDGTGCVLEVIPGERFTWTGALGPGFRPQLTMVNGKPAAPFYMSATILLEDVEGGTRYTAIAVHADEEGAALHSQMGFHQGWGAALDQLVALLKSEA